LSIREIRIWEKYREKYGSLNHVIRTEWGTALIASVIANVYRGKDSPPFKVTDFTSYINEQPISLEDAMKNWI